MTGTTRPARPTLEQLRAVAQPPEVRSRKNAEHWTAELYLRHISIYLTSALVRTPISANGVTGLMILSGWAISACLLIPGIWGPLLAVFFSQLQLYFDCSDGEVARWRGTQSPKGIFLDKIGHYTTEGLIPLALGLRCLAASGCSAGPGAGVLPSLPRCAAGVPDRAEQGAERNGPRFPGVGRTGQVAGHRRGKGRPVRDSGRAAAPAGPFPALPPGAALGGNEPADLGRLSGFLGCRRAGAGGALAALRDGASRAAGEHRPLRGHHGVAEAAQVSAAVPEKRVRLRPDDSTSMPTFGVVILTQGTRPEDLQRGFASLQAQRGVSLDVVVVGNGWKPEGLPTGFKSLHLEENLGIPAGRNAGRAAGLGGVPLLPRRRRLAAGRGLPRSPARGSSGRPDIGMVQPRIEDPSGL